MERLLGGYAFLAGEQLLGAVPADLHAAEQIGLGARHLENALRLERRLGAENLRVGVERDLGAAAVGGAAELLQLGLWLAALEHLAEQLLAARDLDLEQVRQRVEHRHA